MPKQLLAAAPRKAAIGDYEERQLQPNEVKVKVEYASPKHGSELAGFRGESPHTADYFDEEWNMFLTREASDKETDGGFGRWNLGNQWVGIITEAGADVTEYAIGDRVCCYGGVRETHIVNAVNNYYLKKVPAGMSWKNAVCFDPAQFALGGIRDAHVRAGDRVAIFGLGAIGQIAAQMAKLAGASWVAVIDPIEKRREVAIRAGADAAFDPVNQDVGLELKKATGKLGVDVIIETSASEFALQSSLRGLAYGGTIAFVGWARAFKGGLDFGREAHFNNAKIVFSRACSEPNPDYPRWSWRRIEDVCWDMLLKGQINCEEVINPVVPFLESAEGYEQFVDQRPDLSIKLGVNFV
ncbi:zinc-binding dehydrogenase [Paenibacillus sacheonensis]|uniref:Zinc-binding dehydrogenase n=1 Tax=Paenibacillus sacheonensis TaxID=742054 RepID=A0A7X4YPM2_9BACL|nr:zinc-binding dehydrogenase [Paenibacillus sacheonensis]MBM7564739.1 threonine dehydrogenase-like Zn-dependent dehydrogenase [Paenibacillus sacheonensis]NBC69294.1 zinc-binding dehydrogenase [Paenibacillus sacheonensis]